MIVAAISVSVSRYLNPRSLDEEKLSMIGGSLIFSREAHVFSNFSIKSFVEKDFVSIREYSTLRDVTEAVAHSRRNIFPVTDDHGILKGLINLEDVREMMFDFSRYDLITVKELMRKPAPVVSIKDDMAMIMDEFDKSGAWNIAVVDDHGKYLGFISKSRILSSYREKVRVG